MLLKKLTINGAKVVSNIKINFQVNSTDSCSNYLIEDGVDKYVMPAVAMVGFDSDDIYQLGFALDFVSSLHTLRDSSEALSKLQDSSLSIVLEFEDNDTEYTYVISANKDCIYYEELFIDNWSDYCDNDSKTRLNFPDEVFEFLQKFRYFSFDIDEYPKKHMDSIISSALDSNDYFNSLKDYLVQKGFFEDLDRKEDRLVVKTAGEWVSFEDCNATDVVRVLLATIALDAIETQNIVFINALNNVATVYDQVSFITNFATEPNNHSRSQLIFTADQDCTEWRHAQLFDEQVLLIDFEENSEVMFIKN